MGKRYTVSDGKLVLNLEEAEEGGYIVTSPLNSELITQAETIEEAFANARDAAKALRQSRAKLMRRMSSRRGIVRSSQRGAYDHARECMVRTGRMPASLGRQPDPKEMVPTGRMPASLGRQPDPKDGVSH
jgi:antitoxin HicB